MFIALTALDPAPLECESYKNCAPPEHVHAEPSDLKSLFVQRLLQLQEMNRP